MMFKIGDKVSFLNEAGKGEIIEIQVNQYAKVACDDGFDYIYPFSQLVGLADSDSYKVTDIEVAEKVKASIDDVQLRRLMKSVPHTEFVAKGQATWEIDLHIEELIDSYKHLANSEIIQIQISRFKSFLFQAKEKKVRRLIVIHGVGEGVLKNEIWHILGKMQHSEFRDADKREYGYGATEITLH